MKRTIIMPLILTAIIATSGCAAVQNTSEQATPTATVEATPPLLPDGRSAPLTSVERNKFDTGKYIPATDQHPAYNVAKPEKPATPAAPDQENAKEFLTYWYAAKNYALQTGDITLVEEITSPELTDEKAIQQKIKTIYIENKWIEGTTMAFNPNDVRVKEPQGEYWAVHIEPIITAGNVYDSTGQSNTSTVEETYNNQPVLAILQWTENGWVYAGIQYYSDVDYGDDS